MISQKSVWFAWPPPLLRTGVRIASGSESMPRIRSSMDFDWRSGCDSIAAFRFFT
ncbi:hypothetical protein D3C83_195450 [compost metagenome]